MLHNHNGDTRSIQNQQDYTLLTSGLSYIDFFLHKIPQPNAWQCINHEPHKVIIQFLNPTIFYLFIYLSIFIIIFCSFRFQENFNKEAFHQRTYPSLWSSHWLPNFTILNDLCIPGTVKTGPNY